MTRSLVAVGVAGILAGCASTSGPPTLQSGPDAEVTVDGLYRVDNSLVALSYMKPDVDLRGYTALMIDEVGVAYQRDPQGRTRSTGAAGPGNYALTESQMSDLKGYFHDAVVEALTADDGYRIVEAPGPDVLRLSADLIDLVVRIPTSQTGGRGGQFVRSYAEVTVVLEVFDSQSGEILARAADRQDPTDSNQDLVRVERAYVRADVQRLMRYWAGILRERLDAVRQVVVEPIQ